MIARCLIALALAGCSSSAAPPPTAPSQAPAPAPPPAPAAPAATAPGTGEHCGAGDACAAGLACIYYYGVAGKRGGEFRTCERRCDDDADCPADHRCATIFDGPGRVCR